jgi:hypothetical protein
MSKKIKDQIEEDNLQEKTFIISPNEFQYLRGLDIVKRSVEHYHKSLMTDYLKLVSLRLGYKLEDDVVFNIDFVSDKRELTIKRILPPKEDQGLDKKD